MKKTLIALLSILLIAFAFTACDNGNKGPAGPTEEEQTAANDLATTYMGTLQYGDLIDKAINKKDTALTFSSDSKTSLTIEFKDYKVSGTGDNPVTSIKEGAIKFDFTETAPADVKTVMKGYSVSTVEDKPLVFVHKDDTTHRFTFTVEGEKCSIDLVTDSTKITGITKDTLVEFDKPTEATIKVDNIEVTYEDIAENVGDQGSVDPFPASDAAEVVSNIVNGLDKAKILTDVLAGLANDSSDNVPGVKLEKLSALYKGEDVPEAELKQLIAKLLSTPSETSATAETGDPVLPLTDLEEFGRNIADFSITVTASFGQNNKPYTNAFKTGSKAKSIDGGTVTITLYPGQATMGADDTSISLKGIYEADAEDIKITMTDDTVYTLDVNNLDSLFELTSGKGATVYVPANTDNTTSVIIKKASLPEKTVAWSSLSLDNSTGFAQKTAKQADAEYFYHHFGSQNFLNDLYADFAEGNTIEGIDATKNELTINVPEGGIKITTISDEETETKTTDATHEFTLDVTFGTTSGAGYTYYIGGSNQRVKGDVQFTFRGTISGTTFTANEFSVEGDVTLSDATATGHKRANASAELNGDGKFGTNGSIKFTTDAADAGATKITNITNYKTSYSDTTNRFALNEGIESIKITL